MIASVGFCLIRALVQTDGAASPFTDRGGDYANKGPQNTQARTQTHTRVRSCWVKILVRRWEECEVKEVFKQSISLSYSSL